MMEERQVELRELTEVATHAETEEERDDAKRRLTELGMEWRGFPGQRRRGEPPTGVCIR